MSTLERAIEIATEAHRGQRDKAGNDYIGHPLRVMAAGKTPEEKIVGVLHDVVEDSNWTLEGLAAEGFAPEIIEALRCLTHAEEEPLRPLYCPHKGQSAGRGGQAERPRGQHGYSSPAVPFG